MLKYIKIIIAAVGFCALLAVQAQTEISQKIKGIYISEQTLENTPLLQHLIKEAQAVGINTFVIDFENLTPLYRKNIALVKANHIRYVARIIMFPLGAISSQLHSPQYLNRRYNKILQAVRLGADTIQLDYIRYRATQPPSSQNAKDIYVVIETVQKQLQGTGVNLQVDIFGIATFGEAYAIGQSASLFAQSLDGICPMVYPSHYEPYPYHAKRPYETVYTSLVSLRKQLQRFPQVKVYAYIELFNFRYSMPFQEKIKYVLAELAAVRDAKADGWYVWNARNHYDFLFYILKRP